MEKDACENSHQTSEEPHHIRVFPRNYGKLWGQVGKKTNPKPNLKQHITARQRVGRHSAIFGVIAAFKNSSSKVKLN